MKKKQTTKKHLSIAEKIAKKIKKDENPNRKSMMFSRVPLSKRK